MNTMYTIIKHDNLIKVAKIEKEIQDEIIKYDKSQIQRIIKDSIFLWEREKNKVENNIAIATGIIIPMFIVFATTNVLDIIGVLKIIIFFSLLLIYIFYAVAEIRHKGKIINTLYALKRVLEEYL